jgi:hypothetical protein
MSMLARAGLAAVALVAIIAAGPAALATEIAVTDSDYSQAPSSPVISSFDGSKIIVFDTGPGAGQETTRFTIPTSSLPGLPEGVAFGAGGDVYVGFASQSNGPYEIRRYSGLDGSPLGTFATLPADRQGSGYSLKTDAAGNLYVSVYGYSGSVGTILSFDSAGHQRPGEFGNGGQTAGIALGAAGNLWVGSYLNGAPSAILAHPMDGAVVASADERGTNRIFGLAPTPDGQFLVAAVGGGVDIFGNAGGGLFAPTGLISDTRFGGGALNPNDVLIPGDGFVYIAFDTGGVQRYVLNEGNGVLSYYDTILPVTRTETYGGAFALASPIVAPVPEPGSLALASLGALLACRLRRRARR